MIQTTTQTVPVTLKAVGENSMRIDGSKTNYDDWRDDLARDGYAVVKGAIPKERADAYANRMYEWLEGFNLGFDRNDLSTVHRDRLPTINEKGMCLSYAVTHEDFAWGVRGEPGVVGAFEEIYDDKDLIVSFDAINFTFPKCMQGLVNLLPNGPDDGGLIVCPGGHLLSDEFHKDMADEPRIPAWTPEWYGFTENSLKWLEKKGLKRVKVCAEPGDFLLWDSCTPHYNLGSKTNQPRFAVYTCYMPVSHATQEDLVRKKDAFERHVGTTHWPNARHAGSNSAKRDGKDDPYNRFEPVNKPALDERTFKLTGIPYIKA
ncbi:hypothetical protein COCVIDRAFT_41501 [Bipolaris victoriae FI3]|uniref:Phytanoyl-CoA dioxygenase n=1 Tax=Bipolaris victoriae (strain FI3) TaxID=930091 RepID=W7E9W3_BIPV3|nr:hypothetical protein COCVIDRAFT_41501 [Bipolaris victoriae FI3]